MATMKLDVLLEQLGWSKVKLGQMIKVQAGTIYRWKCDSDVPAVVIKFLEQQIRLEINR
jgi:hypothetical protein